MSATFTIDELESKDARRWYGQQIEKFESTLIDLPNLLPTFSRHNFGVNKYLDVIVRSPFGDDCREIPVASVSKKYALVQHNEIAAWLIDGLSTTDYDPSSLIVSTTTTEYGERAIFSIQLCDHVFDPGDGFQVAPVLQVINSVDRTTSLEVRVLVYRLICKNGLYGWDIGKRLRIIHLKDRLRQANIAQFLTNQLNVVPLIMRKFKDWLNTSLHSSDIEIWVDEVLPERWGVIRASRFFSIITTGFDGTVDSNSRYLPPTERAVSQEILVPGACAPVKNAYHALQALSWIASRASSIEESQKSQRELEAVFESLLRSNSRN